MSVPASQSPAVQRQISLPLSKAVEIAYKSIRLRLTRSLVVTTGIVLALAFLISILASEAIVSSIREWIHQTVASDRYVQLQSQRRTMEDQIHQLEAAVRKAAADNKKVDANDPDLRHFQEFQKTFGSLPIPANRMALTKQSSGDGRQAVEAWEAQAAKLGAIRDELNAPQLLEAQLKQKGVALTDQELRDNRIRNRWLIGLALMVAFVGILNAMIMSVTERFREIGTMKCLGALDSFIIKLFLLESLFQGAVGTVLGVILGLGLSLLSATISFGGDAWRNIPVTDLTYAVLITFAVGVGLTVAGALYPAWQAARMHPIEAMRVEA